MKSNALKNIGVIILSFLIITNGFGLIVAGQAKRPVAKSIALSKSVPVPTAGPNVSAQPSTSPLSLPWKTGTLSQPLPIPAGNPDEATAILAGKVSANDAISAAALMTALQLSGFFVMNKDGSAFVSPLDGKGQGLAFAGWEFAATAKLQGEKRTLNLKTFDEAIRKTIPEFSGIEIGQLMLESIREDANNNKNAFLRSWARFIVELGKLSEKPYDIINGVAIDQVELDAVQTQLILRGLFGDMYAFSQKARQNPMPRLSIQGDTLTIKSSLKKNGVPALNYSKQLQHLNATELVRAPAPCQLDGDAPTIMDSLTTVAGVRFGKVLESLQKEFGEAGEKWAGGYAKILSGANILLAYAKFIQTYASMEIKLSAENGPLVRTKNSIAGARKKLQARVVLDIGNWQVFNCLRLGMILRFGVDFSTFSDGPLSGAGVTWHLDQGGGSDIYHNGTGRTRNEQFVGFTSGSTTVQNANASTGQVASATYSKTNSDGVATAILEGSPQRNAKLGKLFEISKTAVVRVTITVKAGEIKGDLADVFGTVVGVAGGPAALLQLPTELLYRADWFSSDKLTIPVTDWEECTGAWSGSITYTNNFESRNHRVDKRVSGRGTDEHDWQMNANYSASVAVTESDNKDGSSVGKAAVEYSVTSIENVLAVERNYCQNDRTWHDMNMQAKTVDQMKANGTVRANMHVGLNADGSYSVHVGTDSLMGKVTGELTGSYSGQCWEKPFKKVTAPPSERQVQGYSITTDIMNGNPANRDHLSDSFTRTSEGRTETVTWDLYRCQQPPQRADGPKAESRLVASLVQSSNRSWSELLASER